MQFGLGGGVRHRSRLARHGDAVDRPDLEVVLDGELDLSRLDEIVRVHLRALVLRGVAREAQQRGRGRRRAQRQVEQAQERDLGRFGDLVEPELQALAEIREQLQEGDRGIALVAVVQDRDD
jgi:hypothetical protein